VTVYPAGDRDNAKPFWERNEIDFFGHTGYVTLALNAGVPIVPVVGVGGGESVFTLTSGSRIAEWTGLKKYLKIHTWPDLLVVSVRVACGPFSCARIAAAHAGDGECVGADRHIGLWGRRG
jgi:1-acyl-sn-glycerol-3-phosphate acyltransferase